MNRVDEYVDIFVGRYASRLIEDFPAVVLPFCMKHERLPSVVRPGRWCENNNHEFTMSITDERTWSVWSGDGTDVRLTSYAKLAPFSV